MVRTQQFLINGRPLLAVFGSYALGKRTVTTCELVAPVDNEMVPLGDGVAICAPGDRCSRVIGEKKALANAMRDWTRSHREQAQATLQMYHEGYTVVVEPVFLSGMTTEPGYGAGV